MTMFLVVVNDDPVNTKPAKKGGEMQQTALMGWWRWRQRENLRSGGWRKSKTLVQKLVGTRQKYGDGLRSLSGAATKELRSERT
jgi:hypothetical protein